MAEVLRLLLPGGAGDVIAEVISAGRAVLGVDGLAVSLLAGAGTELMWCSDEEVRRFEDLQFTLGEGPGPDAVRAGAVVWTPDLAQLPPTRWPALAVEAGSQVRSARAVFCFPMGLGAISVGVLTAVRRTPGPMSAQQADDASILAAALTARCLGNGERADDAPAAVSSPVLHHAVVHQATGMLSVSLAVSLPQALLRLRAHAYGSGRSIIDISQDVVDRRLRLEPGGNGTSSTVQDKD
jgi:hypothetical protein